MDHRNFWIICLLSSMAVNADAAAPDKVEEALGEVRDVKADLFSRESSVLGTLPGPAEMAAHQLRCRPLPKPQAGLQRRMRFDAATQQYAAGLDLKSLKKIPGRMGSRCLPLGITGAYVAEFQQRTELMVTHVQADAPAGGALEVGDVVFGANGRQFP